MHLSLYRKFRPDTFEKMVRQEHVVRILKNQIKSGTVGHAYLFAGPRGTGKTSVARIFARAVNCEDPQDGSPCGVCPSCRALAEGSLDVSEIDAASNNGVGEMRDLREKVQYPPVSVRYKVYIVDEVHMLTDSAFNALLKTLEEPPAHAIFILATTEPQKLPATILSRCMRLDFKLIPQADLEAHLMRILDEIGKPYEAEAVSAIARAGAGSDRDMLSIAEMCLAYGDKLTYEGVNRVLGAADVRQMCDLTAKLLGQDGGGAVEAAEAILSEGKSVGVLLRDLLENLRRVTIAKTCPGAEKLLALPKELYAEIEGIAKAADGRTLLRATEILARTETELRLTSSPRILLETALLRAVCPSLECDVDALMARTAALEKEVEALRIAPRGAFSPAPEEKAAPAPEVREQPTERRGPQVRREQPSAPAFDEDVPPLPEEPIFSDLPIEEPRATEAPSKGEPPVPPVQPEKSAEKAPEKAPAQPVPPEGGEPLTAEMAYGKFMRLLRKTSRNGVLFTMCSDLEARYEGNKLVLLSEGEVVAKMLNREDHRKVMEETFSQLGIRDFEVRFAEAGKKDGLEEFKNNFKEYPIEIK